MSIRRVLSSEVAVASSLALALKVMSAATLFVMNVAITRMLGASASGMLFFAFATVTLLAGVSRLGFDNCFVRFIGNDPSAPAVNSIYRQGLSAATFCSTLIAIGLFCFSDFVSQLFNGPSIVSVLRTICWVIPFIAIYTLSSQALLGAGRYAQSLVCLGLLFPSAVLLLFVMTQPADASAGAVLIVCAGAVAAAISAYGWSLVRPSGYESFPLSRLVRSCKPLWIVTTLTLVTQNSSQLLMGFFGSAEEVSFFNAALKSAMLVSFVLVGVNSVVGPKLARYHALGDVASLQRVAISSVRFVLLVALPIVGLLFIFADEVLRVFGEQFTVARNALLVLATGQAVNALTGPVAMLLTMTGHENSLKLNMYVGSVFAIVLGVITIPSFGLMGGAISTGCGVAIQNLLGVYQVKRNLGFNTLAIWRK